MGKLTRTAPGAVIALAFALLSAAPAAAATPPTRTVGSLGGFVYPAGTACAFDVAGEPSGGFGATTTFSDGSRLISIRARGAYVNLSTGARYPTLDSFRDYGRTDPVTNITTAVESGHTTWSFLPGDQGPFGLITEASLYHFIGTVTYAFDSNAGHATAFAWTGTVEDVCAALS